MDISPLSSVQDCSALMSGAVTIDPSAAIAPGVLLQADPDSQIQIGPGVSIATGAVLHAHGGSLIIEAGASLGAAVLIIGAGLVGACACIGSETTILNPAIAPGETVPPRSLLGDPSRQVDFSAEDSPSSAPAPPPQPTPMPTPELPSVPPSPPAMSSVPMTTSTPPIYGQAALQRLLSTMFPYRQEDLSALPPSDPPGGI